MAHRIGWIGEAREVQSYLAAHDADRDANGRYVVTGQVESFFGLGDDADVLVYGDAEYYVDGKAKNLAAGLATTSHGLPAKVYG